MERSEDVAADDLKVKKRYVVYPGSEPYPMGGESGCRRDG
jgi:hypothetical protein